MRKILLLLMMYSGMVCMAHAQTYEYHDLPSTPDPQQHDHGHIDVNRLRFGAYVAPTITWMHPTSSSSDNEHYHVSSKGSKVGYMWGLMAEYYFAQNYGITTGFDLNVAGGKINSVLNPSVIDPTQANTVRSADFNYRLQYLEIPFALKLRSDELPKTGMRVFGQIGLTMAVNISKKASYDVDYNDQNGTEHTLSASNETLKGTLAVAPIMLQMNIGAGIEYPITEKLYFYTGIFFNNGFLPKAVNPENYSLPYTGVFTNPNIRLNSFALRIGLFF